MKIGRSFSVLGIVVIATLMIGPTLLLIPMSLSAGSGFDFPPKGLSLRWYENFFTSPSWGAAVRNSFSVSLVVAPAATILGTAAAFGVNRLSQRFRGLFLGMYTSPLIVPHLLIALALFSFMLSLRLNGTLPGIMFGQLILVIPFVVIAVVTRLEGYDSRLTAAAARGLGATPAATFLRVTFPLILPGVLAGAVLAFAFSFDELIVALLLQSPSAITLPVKMFNVVTEEPDPTISAASTIVTIAMSIPILYLQIRAARRNRKRVTQ